MNNNIVLLIPVLALALALPSARAAETSPPKPLVEKTLVVWATPAGHAQRGGSALTLEKGGGAVFDAVVFGELAAGKWMPGSDGFSRTRQDQKEFPAETPSTDPVQIAIAYRGNQVSLYRDGEEVATYPVGGLETFGEDSEVLIGPRHTGADPKNSCFTGSIEDARIYGVALSREQIRGLKPNQPSDPKPEAWWDFEDGRTGDRMQRFASASLSGDARVEGGRLHLGTEGARFRARRGADAPAANSNTVARALRETLLGDPYRPGYHFVIPEGLGMPFDPNGAIYWKGRYHLFYIFQDHRGHNWGHVSSTDLLHWRHHPTRLVDGMFSGNAFLDKEGRPAIGYHQVGQGNAVAVALDDNLDDWKKLESNPITPKTQPGDPHHDKYRSWDPYVWLEGDTYYAIFGGERPGLAKAPSLGGEWSYVGDLLANTVPGVSLNEDISCADFFKFGDQYMLLCISHRLGCRYYFGDWKGERFHPTFHAQMSWTDNSYFAPESLLDDRGRRIMWAWILDHPQFKMRTDAGWSGTMSLPRVLTLADDGTLRMNPPEEIERLRYRGQDAGPLRVASGRPAPLDGIGGNSIELVVEMAAATAQQFGVSVCRSPNGEEETRVFYDATDRKLKIDTTRSSEGQSSKSVEGGPLALAPGETLELRIFVDRSVVEVFANGGRQAVMRRMYPARADSQGVALFAEGGDAEVSRVRSWHLSPSNPY